VLTIQEMGNKVKYHDKAKNRDTQRERERDVDVEFGLFILNTCPSLRYCTLILVILCPVLDIHDIFYITLLFLKVVLIYWHTRLLYV